MIQHVYERARRARVLDRVVVATDDPRVEAAVKGFGGEVVMTSPAHGSGTERVAEAATLTDADIVVNVQGDEPMLDPALVDHAVAPLTEDGDLHLSTASVPLLTVEEMLDPSVVKVVVDTRGDALYFSRSPIPHVRVPGGSLADAARAAVDSGLAQRHVGLYVYRREMLLRLPALPPTPLEQAESLEQLRWLFHGLRLRVVPVAAEPGVAVDTPQDLARVRELMSTDKEG